MGREVVKPNPPELRQLQAAIDEPWSVQPISSPSGYAFSLVRDHTYGSTVVQLYSNGSWFVWVGGLDVDRKLKRRFASEQPQPFDLAVFMLKITLEGLKAWGLW